MTVEELIEELNKLPKDATVTIAVGGEASDGYEIEYYEIGHVVSIYCT